MIEAIEEARDLMEHPVDRYNVLKLAEALGKLVTEADTIIGRLRRQKSIWPDDSEAYKVLRSLLIELGDS